METFLKLIREISSGVYLLGIATALFQDGQCYVNQETIVIAAWFIAVGLITSLSLLFTHFVITKQLADVVTSFMKEIGIGLVLMAVGYVVFGTAESCSSNMTQVVIGTITGGIILIAGSFIDFSIKD